jgi:hypothetical protein
MLVDCIAKSSATQSQGIEEIKNLTATIYDLVAERRNSEDWSQSGCGEKIRGIVANNDKKHNLVFDRFSAHVTFWGRSGWL